VTKGDEDKLYAVDDPQKDWQACEIQIRARGETGSTFRPFSCGAYHAGQRELGKPGSGREFSEEL